MVYQKEILQELEEARNVLEEFIKNTENIARIEAAADMLSSAINRGGKIISCGNGGSFCDAMHFAEELTGRYRHDRKPIAATSISDASHITCAANDFGFESIFSRYVEALGTPNDCLFCLSTSGNSPNILKAAATARNKGMKVVALTGKDGGKLSELADIEVRVPHFNFSDRIQEMHIKIIHILIYLIEKKTTQ
jgi:D-sedoheptulose 7-phosphate isomerase